MTCSCAHRHSGITCAEAASRKALRSTPTIAERVAAVLLADPELDSREVRERTGASRQCVQRVRNLLRRGDA